MTKLSKKLLLAIVLMGGNLSLFAQSNQKIPFNKIIIDSKVVYNDSFNLNSSQIIFQYCDSIGNLIDTCTNVYLVKYKKFIFIFDDRHNKSVVNKNLHCYAVLKIDKISNFRWKGYIRKKKSKRVITIKNSCYGGGVTKSIDKGKLETINPYFY